MKLIDYGTASSFLRGILASFLLSAPPLLGASHPDTWCQQVDAESAWRYGSAFGPAADLLSGLPSDPDARFDDAFRLVMEHVLDGNPRALQLSGARHPLLAAEPPLTTWDNREITPPWSDFWFFFADDDPLANWAHPCRYIFVARDLSAIAVQRSRTPLHLPLDTLIPFVPPPALSTQSEPNDLLPRTFSPEGSASNCYAVIISGGYTTNQNATRYWADASAVYSTLTLTYDYPKTNIFTFISDGTNPAVDAVDQLESIYVDSPTDLDGDGFPDTLGEASAANVSNTFLHLQTLLRPSDQLLIFITDHGSHTAGGAERDSELNLWNSEVLRDVDLEALTAPLLCPVLFALEPCYSGGFADNLQQPQRAVATAAAHDTTSSSGDSFPFYDQWCHDWIAALRGFYPATNVPWENADPCQADFNGDGLVSFREAAHFANSRAPAGDNPTYAESPPFLGSRLFLFQPANPISNLTDHIEIAPFRIPPVTHVPFEFTLAARDPLGNVATNFTGTVSLEAIADIVNPGISAGRPDSDFPFLLCSDYCTVRTQVIYPASMMDGPRSLDQLSLHIANPPTQTLHHFTLRLRHSDLETYPAYPAPVVWETDWDTVYQNDLDIPTNGWLTFPFTHAFAYDGERSLMADFSFSNDFSTESASISISYDDVTTYRSIYANKNGEFGDPLTWAETNPPPSRSFLFPYTQFGPLPYQPQVALTPTLLTDFFNGVWTGQLTFLNAADNVRILAHTTNTYWDIETPRFPIRDYLFDLAPPQSDGNGSFTLSWGSGTGYTYRVLRSTHLPHGFTPLATQLPATPPLNTYTTAPDSAPSAFFRIEEEP